MNLVLFSKPYLKFTAASSQLTTQIPVGFVTIYIDIDIWGLYIV